MKSFKDLEVSLINRTIEFSYQNNISRSEIVPIKAKKSSTGRIEILTPLPPIEKRKLLIDAPSYSPLITSEEPDENKETELPNDSSSIFLNADEVIQMISSLWGRLRWDCAIISKILEDKKEFSTIDQLSTLPIGVQDLSRIQNPPLKDDGQFFYCLAHSDYNIRMKYNPYNLKAVSVNEAKSHLIYWTVSASSITTIYQNFNEQSHMDYTSQITMNQCLSTPTTKWLTEKSCFEELCKIHTFKYYRYWKLFTVWKNHITSTKTVQNRSLISRGLVRAESSFQGCITHINSRTVQLINCIDIFKGCSHDNLAPLFIDKSQSFYLNEYINLQQIQLEKFQFCFQHIINEIIQSVTEACQLYAKKIRLDEYFTNVERYQIELSKKKASQKVEVIDDQASEDEKSFSSYLHSERIRVRHALVQAREFLRLVDCQVAHLCHGILMEVFRQFSDYLGTSIADGQQEDEQIVMKIEENNSEENEDVDIIKSLIERKKKDACRTKALFKIDMSLSVFKALTSSASKSSDFSNFSDSSSQKKSNRWLSGSNLKLIKADLATIAESDMNNSEFDSFDDDDYDDQSRDLSSRGSSSIKSHIIKPPSKLHMLVKTLDRFASAEDNLQELTIQRNSQKTNPSCLKLNPDPKTTVGCLKNTIKDIESSLYVIQTISSNENLRKYFPNQYDQLQLESEMSIPPIETLADSMKLILVNDQLYCNKVQHILHSTMTNLSDFCRFAAKFNFYCDYVDESVAEKYRINQSDFVWETHEFQLILLNFHEKLQEINAMSECCRLGTFSISTVNLAKDSRPFIEEIIKLTTDNLSIEASVKNEEFIQMIKNSIKKLDVNPETVEEFGEHLESITKINSELPLMDADARYINQLFTIINNYKVKMSDEQMALYRTLNSDFQKLKNNVVYYEAKKDENIRKFSQDLESRIEKMRLRILEIKEKVMQNEFLNHQQSESVILEQLGNLKEEINSLSSNLRGYSSYQEKFGSSLTKSTNRGGFYRVQFAGQALGDLSASNLQEQVDEVERDISLRYSLWNTKMEWDKWYNAFVQLQLDTTDVVSVQSFVSQISHTISVLEKGLPHNEILPTVKALVNQCKETLPVITALRNPNLQLRHWQKIEQMIGLTITKNTDFTIGDLILSKVVIHKTAIIETSEFANNEMTLEQMLKKVKDVFDSIGFRLVAHTARETWIITGVDDIIIELEESLITIATIKGSKYVDYIRTQVEDWERKLTVVSKVIEEWINCQKLWLFLEQIFSTVDIQRQLVSETRSFNETDSEWRALMKQTQENPLVLRSCTRQGVLQTLQNCNGKLEKIQKSLEDYLETKRIIFPRFFFLSNDELLEILSKVQDMQSVQPHLTKLFANVFDLQSVVPSVSQLNHSLQQNASQIVNKIVSSEGEVFPLPRNIRIRGLAEQWLETIEQGMYESVKRQIKKCLANLGERDFIDWAINNYGQPVLVSLQIKFSEDVTQSLRPEPTIFLRNIIVDLLGKLEKLASSISGDFPHYKRLALEAMIITTVHNRDVAHILLDNQVTNHTDFEWNKQLRYNFDEFSSQCQITQIETVFEYGNEYLGCSPRLVITPLTDKCYLTMTGAMKFNLGGCAKGPAGTGKTETVKDLSKSVGRQCVVFNCSDKLDNSTVAKLFSGIIQIGSWCCFDEFNRMNLEVLSVIAAQIYSIKSAKDANLDRFLFENKEIKLNKYCGIFITMNPTYAGRVHLPDNLSSLFRPVAMMVPDYATISEIILFSEGFVSAKSLSSKISSLYRMCSEQLSKSSHYDFGLRAIKSVLVLAGGLRLQKVQQMANHNDESLHIDEQAELNLLLLAIRISNMPRLIAKDLPLFESSLKDLFPNQNPKLVESEDSNPILDKSIKQSYHDLGFEFTEKQYQKVKHFYAQLLSKHGIIILGPSGSGKTVIRTILQRAMSLLPMIAANLHSQTDKQATTQNRRGKIDVQTINPKAVNINQLYGYVNLNSFEWIEGLLATSTKKMIKIANKFKNQEKIREQKLEKSNQDPDKATVNEDEEDNEIKDGRRKSSLLNVTLSRRLSVLPRLSLASQDPIEDVFAKQTGKNEESHFYFSEKNWQWLVLDGPIDTVWVENLNTVLDDSRILCLSNGERINIPNSLRYIFEVDDLKNTSPATVSRCAVVYISSDCLDWRPQVKLWLRTKLPASFPSEGRKYLWSLFDLSIDRANLFLEKYQHLHLVSSQSKNGQLLTLCALLGSIINYMDTHGGFGSTEDKIDESETSKKHQDQDTNRMSSRQSKNEAKEREYFLEKNPKELNLLLGKIFVFAFTWSYGAAFERQDDTDVETSSDNDHSSSSSIYEVAEEFDSFVHEVFEINSTGIKLPLNTSLTIYSYFVDIERGNFSQWDMLVASTKSLIDSSLMLSSINNKNRSNFIESTDTVRYSFLMNLLITNKFNVLLAGDIGSGKTNLINYSLNNLCKKNGSSVNKPDTILGKIFAYNEKSKNLLESIQNLSKYNDTFDVEDNLNEHKSAMQSESLESYVRSYVKFNSQTSANKALQDCTAKLVKRGQDIVGAPKNKKMIVFIDDLHMPVNDEFGSKPALEMIRQWIEAKGFFDDNTLTWTHIIDVNLIGSLSANPLSPISERLLKNFCLLTLPQSSFNSLLRIFHIQVGRYFQEHDFNTEIKVQIPALVSTVISVYFKVKREFKKSPIKFHYFFNLRSLHQMMNAIKLADDKIIISKDDAAKFLSHEMIREFHDRLINEEDRLEFFKILSDELHMFLKLHWTVDDLYRENMTFGKYFPYRGSSSDDKAYQQITDYDKLIRLFESTIINVTGINNSQVHQFIFFEQAVQHIIRINRILLQQKSHMLLLGVEGYGRYSNVKMAATLSSCEVYRLTMTHEYSASSFRNDIKRIIEKSILQNKLCVLYLSDVNDLFSMAFMDDLCCLLSSGDIPDLYETEEVESILAQMKSDDLLNNKGMDSYQKLITKINTYLHCIIGVSPTNPQCKQLLKSYPDLLNCCTIDWYNKWTDESYMNVATQRISEIAHNISLIEDVQDDTIIKNLALTSKNIFISSMKIGEKFVKETHRHYFLTSGDFVEYLNMLSKILSKNYKSNRDNRQRLITGLNQLNETKILIGKMKEELIELTPQIKEKTEETEQLLEKLMKDKKAVSEVETIVKDEEEIIKLETESVEKYSHDCERDLESVIPVLNEAIEALNSLDKASISEVRVYMHPPEVVVMVMNAVCVLLALPKGWSSAKLLLGDANFLINLQNYDKDSISPKMYRELKSFTSMSEFNPVSVEKVSTACKSICQWVLAIENYYKVHNMLIPKKKNVEIANKALQLSRQKMEWKRNQLLKVQHHLDKLDMTYQHSLEEQQLLKERERLTNERLVRAVALIQALQSEKSRWEKGIEECDECMKNILGNNLLSAAYTVFAGPLNYHYREEIKSVWMDIAQDNSIAIQPTYKFIESEFSTYEVLEWHNNGLPRDTSMAENVAISSLSDKWSLLVDPQNQGKNFLQTASKSKIKVVSCKQKDYTQILERAIRVGDSVLLEDIETHIDPTLGPLMRREIFRKNNVQMIRIGDNEVEYSPSFKIYLMTSYANPVFQSSVSRLVTVINFTVNLTGLQEQLLSVVVSMEKPEIEEERNQLLKTYAEDLKKIRDLEDKTLSLIQSSTEKLVNDSELSQNLEESKSIANDIKERLILTFKTEKDLQKAREFYLPLAMRGALIYFVIADFGVVNTMYQFSLLWLKQMFSQSVEKVTRKFLEESSELNRKSQEQTESDKLQQTIELLTFETYEIVSEALFSQHKILLSFMLCTAIMKYKPSSDPEYISSDIWSVFIGLHTASAVTAETINVYDKNGDIFHKIESIEWLSNELWNKSKYLENKLPMKFSGFCLSLVKESQKWTHWRNNQDKWTVTEQFEYFNFSNLASFDKLILISLLVSARFVENVLVYVRTVFGRRYTTFYETNLMKIFTETPSKTPIVFILGPNSDPVNNVQKLACELRSSTAHLDIVSMGRGQAVKAESLIQKTNIHKGRWIYLQNCDLITSWLPQLLKIIENLQVSKQQNDPNFRLIMSTHSHKEFPLGILQLSRKVAIESPIGIKNQMLKSFAIDGTGNVSLSYFDNQNYEMKKMIYNLCLFNAILLERRNYGALGFNTIYDFNDSDLEISIMQLPSFIEKTTKEVQWSALHKVVGSIHYGGRVTDPLDARCLYHLLRWYLNENIFNEPTSSIDLSDFQSINLSLHNADFMDSSAELLLGLGKNAEDVKLENQTKSFLYDVLAQQSYQIDSSGSPSSSNNQDIVEILKSKVPKSVDDVLLTKYGKEFLKQIDSSIIPIMNIAGAIIDDKKRSDKYNSSHMLYKPFLNMPYHNVLRWEIKNYNHLLAQIHSDLDSLIGHLVGEKVITEQLESVFNSIVLNSIPHSWNIMNSCKSLTEWISNLQQRVDFMALWSHKIITQYHFYINLFVTTVKEIELSSNDPDPVKKRFRNEQLALEQLNKKGAFDNLNNNISCYWLPGFLSQKGFLMAILQTEARKLFVPVDSLEIKTKVLNQDPVLNAMDIFTQSDLLDVTANLPIDEVINNFEPNDIIDRDKGTFVFGIYLDNAIWQTKYGHLSVDYNCGDGKDQLDCAPIKRFCKLPVLHLLPTDKLNQAVSSSNVDLEEAARDHQSPVYKCPLYKTSERRAVQHASSLDSDQLVLLLDLPIPSETKEVNTSFWVMRGTAALLECHYE